LPVREEIWRGLLRPLLTPSAPPGEAWTMRLPVLLLAVALVGCGGDAFVDSGGRDASADAATHLVDAGSSDGGVDDGGDLDGGALDGGALDGGDLDGGALDGGDPDGGDPDGGAADAGEPDGGSEDAGTPPVRTTALLRPENPLKCADPAVVSEGGAGQTSFVFCTGMSHVWKTSDWVHFVDARASVTFDLSGMSTNGKKLGAWWAPGVVYSAALQQYVMWASVPDAQATNTSTGWDTRSLAVLTATSPTGPWTFQALAMDAAVGQHFIDPFLFIDHDGGRYVYWKQYGGGLSSSIMGARVNSSWTGINTASRIEIMNGYGGPGTWEDNVRENPAVRYDPVAGVHHLIFSGGHWFNDTYATGHALSTCGPLCPASTAGGWHMVDSGDRGILQVVRSTGDADFASGGPGGAVFLDEAGTEIVYAAAAKSASGDAARYLMLDDLQWKNRAPYVDTAGHLPLGF
jgi:hypothetical protein